MNRFLVSLLGLVFLAQAAQAELLFGVDFSEAPEGPAKKYLHMSNFDAQQNAQDKLRPEVRGGRLILELGPGYLGGYTLRRDVEGAKKLRVRWGVESYPKGADWEDDEKREAVMVVVVFKTERVSAGSWLLPALPRYLGIFLSDSAQGGKWYQGNYYEEGGRYRCEPCNAPAGEEVVSEIDLEAAYQENFGEPMPPILGFGIEFDTRGIEGDSKAFVRSIELLGE
ncbi:MAG: hypothetical protein RRB13_12895 [bacterium]|nr:hypothetical protein [bacterium]